MPTRLEDLYGQTPENPPPPPPPTDRPARARPVAVASPMARLLQSLLNPVVLQRLLVTGGGLFVIGLLITLASYGIFDNPVVAATALTLGSFAVIGGGWVTILKTRHTLVGVAMTFLGCVVLPLNLWFYHAQNLIRVDQHLWVCGLICVAIYAATVYRLRKPVFLYAVQLGVLLTTLLLLGQLDIWNHLNWISTVLVIGGLVTMHLPLALSTEPTANFDRKRFGLPLVIGGHVQMVLGLVVLGSVQLFGYQFAINHYVAEAGIRWQENIVWLSVLWLIGAYSYFATAVMRRHSIWILPAVICLVATSFQWLELTGIDTPWRLLAISGLGSVLLVVSKFVPESNDDFSIAKALNWSGLAIAGFCHLGLAMRAFMLMGTVEPLLVKMLPLIVGAAILAISMLFVSREGKAFLGITAILQLALVAIIVSFHSTIPVSRKFEIFTVGMGIISLVAGTVRQLNEAENRRQPENTLVLWIGSLCVSITLLTWGMMARFGVSPASVFDEPILLIGGMLLVVMGIISQVKATTAMGITMLGIYIVTLIGTLLHAANLAAGIYLGVGGAVIFTGAIILTLLRERLLTIPERMSKREGVFQFLNWR